MDSHKPLTRTCLGLLLVLCYATSSHGQSLVNVIAKATGTRPGSVVTKTEFVAARAGVATVKYSNVIFKNNAMHDGVKYRIYLFVNHYPVLFYRIGASPVVYNAGSIDYGQEKTIFATPNNRVPALFWAYAYPMSGNGKTPWDKDFASTRAYVWDYAGNYRLITNPFGQKNEVARVGFRPLPINKNADTKITLTIQ